MTMTFDIVVLIEVIKITVSTCSISCLATQLTILSCLIQFCCSQYKAWLEWFPTGKLAITFQGIKVTNLSVTHHKQDTRNITLKCNQFVWLLQKHYHNYEQICWYLIMTFALLFFLYQFKQCGSCKTFCGR